MYSACPIRTPADIAQCQRLDGTQVGPSTLLLVDADPTIRLDLPPRTSMTMPLNIRVVRGWIRADGYSVTAGDGSRVELVRGELDALGGAHVLRNCSGTLGIRARAEAAHCTLTVREAGQLVIDEEAEIEHGRRLAPSRITAFGGVVIVRRGLPMTRVYPAERATVRAAAGRVEADAGFAFYGRLDLSGTAECVWEHRNPLAPDRFAVSLAGQSRARFHLGPSESELTIQARERAQVVVQARAGRVQLELTEDARGDLGPHGVAIVSGRAHCIGRGRARLTLREEATYETVGADDQVVLRDERVARAVS